MPSKSAGLSLAKFSPYLADRQGSSIGRGRIRTSEGNANGFTARPLWPLGYTPLLFGGDEDSGGPGRLQPAGGYSPLRLGRRDVMAPRSRRMGHRTHLLIRSEGG